MIKSMTGFGRGECKFNAITFSSEIKSVNHRYCEISVKLPRRFSYAEEAIKAVIKQYANRGKIELTMSVVDDGFDSNAIHLNIEAAKAYTEALNRLNKEALEGQGTVTLSMLSSNPDVLKTVPPEDDEEALLNAITKSVDEACKNFCKMREVEGEKLVCDILSRGKFIRETVESIEEYAPSVKKAYFEKLHTRIADLLDGAVEIPEDRILVEAAVFADKADITEEITRLKSHCDQLEKITKTEGEPVGKKLDFLVQEMNRESNTIGSKANDLSITEKVLSMKNEIEKIREQIQNIE